MKPNSDTPTGESPEGPDDSPQLARETNPWRMLERLRDAHRAELRAIRNPYRLLAELAHDRRYKPSRAEGIQHAMGFYTQFVALLTGWPPADREALLSAATRVFSVPIRQLRRDAAAAAEARP